MMRVFQGLLQRKTARIWGASVTVSVFCILLVLPQGRPLAQAVNEIQLTMQDCIHRALENNLNLQVSRFEPRIASEDLEGEKAQFDSSIDSSSYLLHEERPAFFVGQSPNQEVFAETVTYRDRVVTGFDYEIAAESARFDGSQLVNVLSVIAPVPVGPVFSSSLSLSITQPLLRNRGRDAQKTTIRVTRNNQRISDTQFRQTVLDTLKTVEEAYWELVFAIRDLEVRRQSLRRAERFLEENRVKVEVGTLAPIEITTAEAEVASRKQDVIVGENSLENAEDNLKVLISSMENPIWDEDIRPVDRPPFVRLEVDLEERIQTAFKSRPDLQEQRLRMDNDALQLQFQANQRQYGLDLVGNWWSRGQINRSQVVLEPDPANPPICDTDPTDPSCNFITTFPQAQDGLTDSWDQVFDLDFTSWDAQLLFTVPLSNREAKSQYAAARLRKEQSTINYELLRQLAIQEVRRAARQIDTDRQRVEAGQVNVRLQREKLDAEEKKYENGMSTSFQVLEFQEDLAEAERTVARAIIDYNISLAELDRVTGTLAESRGVIAE